MARTETGPLVQDRRGGRVAGEHAGRSGRVEGMPNPHLPSVPGVTRLVPMAHRGFSSVYGGYQERFDRWVAVKVIAVGPGERLDAAARRRFERECAVTGRMSNHPNVVGIFDCGILEDGQPYLVTELCEQGSLADRLASTGPVAAEDAVDIGTKIAAALRDTHGEGIVHRDVKPANILVRASGEPALADFGLSVRTDSDASRGLDAFSPAYAPPETLADGRQSAAGDVYSLGATLYTLLAGRPPVPVVAGEAPLTYLKRVIDEPVAPIDRSDVAPELADTVLAMLARRPEDRPTAAEVVARLEPLRGAGSAPWAVAGSGAQLSPEDTASRRALESETRLRPVATPARKRLRIPHVGPRLVRRAALAVAAAAALVAVAAVAIAYGPSLALLSGPGDGAAPAPTTTPSTTTPSATTPSTTAPSASDDPAREPPPPEGYREVHGPRGLTVAVPEGWTAGPAASPHVRKVADPADPQRFALIGGEAREDRSQLDRVEEMVSQLDDYRPVVVRQVRFGGAEDAVEWQFGFTLDGRDLVAHGLYWRIDGVEYAVYSRAPEQDRARMEAVYDVMVQTAWPR